MRLRELIVKLQDLADARSRMGTNSDCHVVIMGSNNVYATIQGMSGQWNDEGELTQFHIMIDSRIETIE